MTRYLRIIGLLATAGFSAWPGLALAWYNASWTYRVPILVPAGASVNSTIKVDVDFNALLTSIGVAGTLDGNSPRVVRSDDATLTTYQEFTESVYAGATDTTAGRGEVRFILQDAGATTYYLYFDITANGPKSANPQTPINGNFEQGTTGTQSPTGWTATKVSSTFDAQVRPSESPSITTNAGSPSRKTTDGTPYSGAYSYLLGARTNNEAINSYPSVTLTRTITVPATNPGNITVNYRLEGWDSSDNGATVWDYLRIRLVGTATTEIVGPTAGSYTTYPFSPNKGTGQIGNNNSGYGYYNYWDMDRRGRHHAGMTLTAGSQPWFTRTYSLSAYAGQTITLQMTYSDSVYYKSWVSLDDIEWSVVAAGLGTPETNVVTPGGFNAYETTTAAGAITGVIKTKIAGQAFNLDIIALDTARTAIQTAFTGEVKVELLDAGNNSGALDANGCRSTWTTIQTLGTNPVFASGDNGRKAVSFTENNAWQDVRVRITYPASGTATAVGCSNDNFAIRPNAFAGIVVSDSTWQTAGTTRTLNNTSATASPVHKAGWPVRLYAVAANAVGNTTNNYAGTPAGTVACTLPATCANGTFTVSTAAVSGVLADDTATYSEAGAFTLQLQDSTFANVDSSDSSLAERTISSTPVNVGRFVPDHFDLAAFNTPVLNPFSTFTYIGQPFGYVTPPQYTITARNKDGGTTANYAYNLWKLADTDITQTYSSTPTLITVLGTPTLTSYDNGTGLGASNGSDTLQYTRSGPIAPFNAQITLTASVKDTSESEGNILTNSPAVFNNIAFLNGYDQFRYGRLRLDNANGSEQLPLQVPLQAQYFDGFTYVTNSDDSGTSFTVPTGATCGSATTCTFGDITLTTVAPNNLATNIWVGSNNPTLSSNPLASGLSGIHFVAPNAAGAIDVMLTVPSWLQYNWKGTGNINPAARATWGIYKSPSENANRFIYMREY